MPIRGLDSDNGTEFLSRELVAYCASPGITFTRSRPYTKNDNFHVELCGCPHNSTYPNSAIMPIAASSGCYRATVLGELISIIPGRRRSFSGRGYRLEEGKAMNEIRKVPVFGPLAVYADDIRSELARLGYARGKTISTGGRSTGPRSRTKYGVCDNASSRHRRQGTSKRSATYRS
jgi:hypothetical protein